MTRDYVIIACSTSDMGADYYNKNNVECLGFHYVIDGNEYIQYSENALDCKSFYDMVRAGSMPKTSQVAYDTLVSTFERHAKEGRDIFYLSFSGALSGSYSTSCLARDDVMQKYPDCTISVVDSISACSGEGMLLHKCVQKRNAGASLKELTEYAEQIKYKICHVFTVDDLDHLHRGGRLSKLSAVVGGMLGIKPILYFDDSGRLLPYAKIRGRKQSLDAMAEQMKKKYVEGENREIFINHGDDLKSAEYLGDLIMKMMPDVKKVRYNDVGAVIGSHTGANVIALFFVGNNREPV